MIFLNYYLYFIANKNNIGGFNAIRYYLPVKLDRGYCIKTEICLFLLYIAANEWKNLKPLKRLQSYTYAGKYEMKKRLIALMLNSFLLKRMKTKKH